MIKLFRIDDRLIHGQVAMAWTKFMDVNQIIVVDDESANDKMKSMILNLAKPSSTDLDIVSTSEFIDIYNKYKSKNIMVVIGSIEQAVKILPNLKSEIPYLNIGGIRHKEGRSKITDSVFLSDHEKSMLNEFKDLNIKIVLQATPNGSKTTY
ncbi:PTS sugar transporter subunit IIB [Anaerococcus sp. Marseille-Q7828]|uniref:PTS sugar transporter subunit IIB n=1 Tax=Anaerococcus sp. Marseille-Q7828 TaxID=3036300 RepID=UPI0024AD4EB4|nr:PTS sugar transporter subunit IIB [Anaerococcus sp. Marseille-Q7828]